MRKISNENLVPDRVNPTPDYYCTWQTQLFATCDGKPAGQRAYLGERALFQREKPDGWAYFYEDARRDLLLVLDDSWDVPLSGDPDYYGSLMLSLDKFPSYAKEGEAPQEGLAKLCGKIKELGWKGLGGWVCAQEAPLFLMGRTREQYWTERLGWAKQAGMAYWKVDWGAHCREESFRKWLVDLARRVAPRLTMESALVPEVLPCSDVFRSYDVPALLSIPYTMDKLGGLLRYRTEEGYRGLLNCEDEAYLAAALGCAMGIMRHPYAGALADGRPDPAFPSCHRNLKTKMDEVTRAARWHRIAPAFAVDGANTNFAPNQLMDFWELQDQKAELEDWWLEALKNEIQEQTITKPACAAISRNMELPKVTARQGVLPYVVCAKNPNGAVSVATLGRTQGRDYLLPRCEVVLYTGKSEVFGIFGEYEALVVHTGQDLSGAVFKAQDLAGEQAVDITHQVTVQEGRFILPGQVIHEVGTMSQHPGDTSEPGMVLIIQKEGEA